MAPRPDRVRPEWEQHTVPTAVGYDATPPSGRPVQSTIGIMVPCTPKGLVDVTCSGGRTRSPPIGSVRHLGSPVRATAGQRAAVASLEALQTGDRLDEHHLPETNGRMAICRRCSARTDSPGGSKHVPGEHQLARSDEWLAGQ